MSFPIPMSSIFYLVKVCGKAMVWAEAEVAKEAAIAFYAKNLAGRKFCVILYLNMQMYLSNE